MLPLPPPPPAVLDQVPSIPDGICYGDLLTPVALPRGAYPRIHYVAHGGVVVRCGGKVDTFSAKIHLEVKRAAGTWFRAASRTYTIPRRDVRDAPRLIQGKRYRGTLTSPCSPAVVADGRKRVWRVVVNLDVWGPTGHNEGIARGDQVRIVC